jgi:hypothetical protein
VHFPRRSCQCGGKLAVLTWCDVASAR